MLCYKIWSQLYILWYIFRCCLDFNLIMMFRFFGTAGLSGCCEEWVHMRSVGEDENAYIHFFLCSVPYGTRGKFPSFTCKVSSWLFWRCNFMSIFNSTIEYIPCQSSNMRQARQCRGLNHDQSECVGFGVCQVGSKWVWRYGYNENCCRPRQHGTEIRIRIWRRLIGRWRHFCSEWQWHRWHCWHKLHTVACQ